MIKLGTSKERSEQSQSQKAKRNRDKEYAIASEEEVINISAKKGRHDEEELMLKEE